MISLPFILIGIVVLAILWFIFSYNGLISRRNQIDEAWADIDVQLKRRYDLIPNVVETVKGYAGHEKGVLESVTNARTQAMGAQSADQKAKAENTLSGTLKTLFAVAENYPNLKANENFLDLQRELADTENKIQAARRFYNGTVRDYNTKIQSFPTRIIASMFNFLRREFFDLDETPAVREPVQVKF